MRRGLCSGRARSWSSEIDEEQDTAIVLRHALPPALAPVVQPKIAFALVAEDAGPAEYAGAKIAHDFLVAVQPTLR